MAVTSGFYNSVDGDRKYNALQMSSIFDGIIEDGVYNSIGDRFSLTAGEGNTVIVGTGRAWFNHSWTLNDADYPLEIDPAEVVLNRYDAIVIEVNGSAAVRNNSIKVIKGTAGSSPSKPSMANGEGEIWQHPLGYIYVPAGASSITQSNIEYAVGTSECPFVVAAVQSVDIDALVAQWSDQFNTWFDNLETQLAGDVAGNLQNQINQKVDKANVIDDLEDLIANRADGMVAGAKAVSELTDNIMDTESAELRNNFGKLLGYAERRGKIVSITSVFSSEQWAYQDSDWVTIGTIPASMRPKRQQNGTTVYGSQQDRVTGLRVTTNGNVQVYFRAGTGQYLSFSISYSVE